MNMWMNENEYFVLLSTVGMDNSAFVILDFEKPFEMVIPHQFRDCDKKGVKR